MHDLQGREGAIPDIRAAFADPAFAAARAGGVPFAVLRPDAGAVVWANAAAARHFGAEDAEALARALLGPGGWLGDAAGGLAPGRPPRFARAGLARGLGMRANTALLRLWTGADGAPLIGLAVPDAPGAGDWLRPAWSGAADPAVDDPEPDGASPPPDPEAGPALARRGQIAVLRDRLNQAVDGVAAPRLLWRADADGFATPVDAGLLARLGVPLDFAAAPLPAVFAPHDPEGAGRLADALARRETWSGVAVELPLAGGAASAPLTLSASPLLGPDRSFAGFRGFGVLDLGRLTLARPKAGQAPDEGAPEIGAAPEVEAAPVPGAEPGLDAPPAEAPADVETPSAEAAREPKAEATPEPEAAPAAAEPAADGAPDAPAAGANVVRLRPFQGPPPGRAPAGPAEADPEPPHEDDLAFRALGDALRARIGIPPRTEGDRPGPAPPEAGAPPPAARAPEPGAPGLLERLPIAILACVGRAPVYANPAAAAQLGYADPDAVLAAGPELIVSDGEPLLLRGADGQTATVPARRSVAAWAGKPATLYVLDPSAAEAARDAPEDGPGAWAAALLDRVDDAVALLEADGRLRALNRRGADWLGPLAAGAEGPGLADLLAPGSRPAALALLEEARARRDGPPLRREVEVLAAAGAAAGATLTLGRLDGAHLYATLREAPPPRPEEARPAGGGAPADGPAREAGRFAALIAKVNHEIRTPLNAILGFAEVMVEERLGPLGNPRYRDYLRDIHAAGSRVVALVEDLLDLSRVEAGTLDLALEPIDVNRIVSDAVAQMQPEAHRGRVIVRTSLAGRLPSALADDRAARQIVRNLLSNAVKFNEPGGQVIVSTALGDAGAVLLRVRDTGVGMTEDEIAAAFEPFDQATAARSADGNGLGLPVTRALAGANGASITIRSRPREGTLVEVAFAAAGPGGARLPA